MSDLIGNDLDQLKREYARRDVSAANNELYSPLNLANLFSLQFRERAAARLLGRHGIKPSREPRILEIGCGRGGVLLDYLGYGFAPGRLHGVELLLNRLKDAHGRLPHLQLVCADGRQLPYENDAFDLVMQYTVFSSILVDQVRISLAREMLRVLKKPGGVIVWYDFWLNPSNQQTRGIRRAEIRNLFPECRFEFEKITLAPPLARRLAPTSWMLASLLESLKVLNTHYLVAIRPR